MSVVILISDSLSVTVISVSYVISREIDGIIMALVINNLMNDCRTFYYLHNVETFEHCTII